MPYKWTVPVMTYHRVGEPKGDHVPTVTPEAFESHLRFLRRWRYEVLSLDELVERLSRGDRLSRRTAAITFDDGYEETCTVAAPLLARYGFPATVFISPIEVGMPGFVTWEQLKMLVQNGLKAGSHTMHHTYLPLASREQVQRELVESKRLLEERLGQPVRWLSYPIGGFTPDIQAIAKAAGYRAAWTTNRAASPKGPLDLFALRRIKMTEGDRFRFLIWVKLSGYYDVFRRLEQPA